MQEAGRVQTAAGSRWSTPEAAPDERTSAENEALVVVTMQRHADALLRIARRHSLCDDDAADAVQRSLEIFLRHVARLDAETAHRWLFRVARHEAMAVREQRQRTLGAAGLEPDLLEARHVPSPEDRVLELETTAQSAEALRALKAAEVQALSLQAAGNSYAQIAELSGWTRTKVNRSLVEGRRRFLAQRDAIDAGTECARWRPVLAALVVGRASARELSEVRPHLRHCQACRAHVRGLHRAGPGVGGVVPVGLLLAPLGAAGSGRVHGWWVRAHEAVLGAAQERLTLQVIKVQAAADALSAGKLAAVAASAAAIAGGGAAVAGDAVPGGEGTTGRTTTVAAPVVARGREAGTAAPVAPATAVSGGLTTTSVAATALSGGSDGAGEGETTTTATATVGRPQEFAAGGEDTGSAGELAAAAAAVQRAAGPGPEEQPAPVQRSPEVAATRQAPASPPEFSGSASSGGASPEVAGTPQGGGEFSP